MNNTGKVYTIKEVAVILKVNPITVRKWIQRGLIKSVRIGRTIRINEDELKRLSGEKID